MKLRGLSRGVLTGKVDYVFKLLAVGAVTKLVTAIVVAGIVWRNEPRRIHRGAWRNMDGNLTQAILAHGHDDGVARVDALDGQEAAVERDLGNMKIERYRRGCIKSWDLRVFARWNADLERRSRFRSRLRGLCDARRAALQKVFPTSRGTSLGEERADGEQQYEERTFVDAGLI